MGRTRSYLVQDSAISVANTTGRLRNPSRLTTADGADLKSVEVSSVPTLSLGSASGVCAASDLRATLADDGLTCHDDSRDARDRPRTSASEPRSRLMAAYALTMRDFSGAWRRPTHTLNDWDSAGFARSKVADEHATQQDEPNDPRPIVAIHHPADLLQNLRPGAVQSGEAERVVACGRGVSELPNTELATTCAFSVEELLSRKRAALWSTSTPICQSSTEADSVLPVAQEVTDASVAPDVQATPQQSRTVRNGTSAKLEPRESVTVRQRRLLDRRRLQSVAGRVSLAAALLMSVVTAAIVMPRRMQPVAPLAATLSSAAVPGIGATKLPPWPPQPPALALGAAPSAAAAQQGLLTRSNPQRSPERAAVDAVAEGRYEVAIELYRRLAETDPTRPAYAEAARILSERLRVTERPRYTK